MSANVYEIISNVKKLTADKCILLNILDLLLIALSEWNSNKQKEETRDKEMNKSCVELL